MTDTQTHSWIMSRQWSVLEYSAINGMCLLNPTPKGLDIYIEEKVERLYVPKAQHFKEIAPSRHKRVINK